MSISGNYVKPFVQKGEDSINFTKASVIASEWADLEATGLTSSNNLGAPVKYTGEIDKMTISCQTAANFKIQIYKNGSWFFERALNGITSNVFSNIDEVVAEGDIISAYIDVTSGTPNDIFVSVTNKES